MADTNLSSFIWSVADLLRGDYKQSEYGKVILPFTVLRRLDCVLEPTKSAVLAELAKRKGAGVNPEPFLLRKSGQLFCNTSPLDLKKLMGDQNHIGENLRKYLEAFSPAVRDIFERFEFHTQIDRLAKAGLLYLVTEKFEAYPDGRFVSAVPRQLPTPTGVGTGSQSRTDAKDAGGQIVSAVLRQLPWTHHLIILGQCRRPPEALRGALDILLNHSRLWEALRGQGGADRRSTHPR